MSIERTNAHYQEDRPGHAVQITTHLSHEFLSERPGWLANYVRKVAQKALEVMEADDATAFEATTVASELAANAVEHGDALDEFDVVHYPASDEAHREAVYVVTVNPTNDVATPGTLRRGSLAAAEPNDSAESGRGLLMTDVYTNHNWGQRNIIDRDGVRKIITFAVLSPSATDRSSTYRDVA